MKLPAGRANWLYALAFLWLLGGCVSLPERPPAAGGFDLRGKLGIVQGDESFSARMLWRQGPRGFAIDLWGPLGQGRVNLTGGARRIELRRGDGAVISQGPPEAVMEAQLGWSLPLDVLPRWVRGEPAPGLPVSGRDYDDHGRLTAFEQEGWRVRLGRFGPVAEDVELPHRITAERGPYRVRLVVSEWRI